MHDAQFNISNQLCMPLEANTFFTQFRFLRVSALPGCHHSESLMMAPRSVPKDIFYAFA